MLGNLFFNSSGDLTDNKSSFRIYRGWDYFFKMPFLYKVFGIGFVHMKQFTVSNNISSIYDSNFKEFEWFSGITEILLYFGIVGLILFLIHIFKMFKVSNKSGKIVTIVFMILMFTSQTLFLDTHLFYYLFVLALLDKHKICVEEHSFAKSSALLCFNKKFSIEQN